MSAIPANHNLCILMLALLFEGTSKGCNNSKTHLPIQAGYLPLPNLI